jgi:hypothetical protein
MKKLLIAVAALALLFLAACGAEEDTPAASGTATPAPPPVVTTPTPDPPPPPPPAVPSPQVAISAFFGYLASGNPTAADALFTHSGGEFAGVAYDMYEMLDGNHIFSNISYRDVSYTVDGNNATATFMLENTDFFQASYEVGFAIGQAGLLDVTAPDFETQLTALMMPMLGEMISNGTAPTFEAPAEIRLRLVDNNWQIVDDSEEFAMMLLGMW